MNILKEAFILNIKVINKFFYLIYGLIAQTVTYARLTANSVGYGKGFKSNGIPVIRVHDQGLFIIGNDFKINNGMHFNQIGRQQPCYFIVGAKAELHIGNNVGISASALICMHRIVIEDNVKIGGNTVVYDTDFHSINPENRLNFNDDKSNVKTKPVIIKKNAFIGAHTTILKGVVIGENSILGAGSVVTKEIPDNEIWAGNPAKFVKKIEKHIYHNG